MNHSLCLSLFNRPTARWLRLLVWSAVSTGVGLVVVLFLVLEDTPAIWQSPDATQHYVAATRNILKNSSVVVGQSTRKARNISLSGEDISALVNFALLRKRLSGFAEAEIDGQRLVLRVTVKLPGGHFLNLKLIADDAEPKAYIKQAKAGFIALPRPLVDVVVWWALHMTHIGHYVQLADPLLQEVRIGEGRLRFAVNWDPQVMGQVQDLVADLADKERLRVYQAKLAEVVGQAASRRFIGLASLIRPLFTLAQQRSAAQGGDALEENRAVILVLAAYANGKSLAPAIFADGDAPALAQRGILLSRRVDAAQHFTASALLATSGHRAFADMIGLAKEFNDTHGGSGFSFIDLAADRAGALMGKLAVESRDSALKVQSVLSQAVDETVFMPGIRDLPENIRSEDFTKRFGGVESAEFQQLRQLIEERIAACPLYR